MAGDMMGPTLSTYGGYKYSSDGTQRLYDNGVVTDQNGAVTGYNNKADQYSPRSETQQQQQQASPEQELEEKKRKSLEPGAYMQWQKSAPNFDPAQFGLMG